MATLTSVTNHFPKPKEGFITTLGSSILAGAATVPLNSTSGLTNGDVFVGLIEPGETNEQCFTGIVDTGGNQITGVKWTTGSNVAHTAGVTIVDYVTSTTVGIISKGILVEHNQDGTHSDITADSATITDLTVTNFTIDGTAGADGWSPLGQSVNTVTANGNRSYTLVVNGANTTGTTSVGQKLKIARTVTAPTQCADLEASSSQYFNDTTVSGMTFTDDFVVSAWVKLESYNASANQAIASRYNGTSGWSLYITPSGTVTIIGFNGGASNQSNLNSYQSIPLGRWVHIAAQADMSAFTNTPTTGYIMIDGVDVPAAYTRGGTNPTALVQAGNLEIGSQNGGTSPFDGKIAQVAIYSAKVTQATILASMNQTLTGSETSLVSAYTFNNSINDLSANANNLTANGGALATNSDTPFTNPVTGTSVTAGTTNYGIIMSQSFSTNTTYIVQVPEGETLPTTGGIGTVSYSTQKTPYGFPGQRGKWMISSVTKAQVTQGSAVDGTWYNIASHQLTIPTGEWVVTKNSSGLLVAGTSYAIQFTTLSTGASSESDTRFTQRNYYQGTTNWGAPHYIQRPLAVTTPTVYYLNHKQSGGTGVTLFNTTSDTGDSFIEAENAYL